MTQLRLVAAVPTTLAMLLAACGGDGEEAGSASEPRTVEIAMVDIAYEPESVEVAEGETVRFVFRNEGQVDHDAFVGDEDAQQAHEDEMRSAESAEVPMGDGEMGDMGGGEEGIVVAPGDTGELTHTFDEPGQMLIGCHEPDHYEAGMLVEVDVS